MAEYRMGYDANTGGYDTSFWTPEQWQKFGASGGTIGPNGEVVTGTGSMLTSDQLKPANLDTGGLFGLSGNQWGALTNVGGLAMKAMALPLQTDYFKTQIELAKQQRASNQQAMADKKAFNANFANASNSVMGSGLANRSTQVV